MTGESHPAPATAAIAAAPPPPADETLSEKALTITVAVFAFVLIFMQKLALPLGGLQVSLVIPAFYGVILVLLATGNVHLSVRRLGLFAAFLAVAMLSQMMVSTPLSATSFLNMLVLYLPLVLVCPVEWDRYLKLLRVFQNFMLVGAAMIVLQLVYQFIAGFGHTLSIEPLIPKRLLLDGYLYDPPIRWGAKFVRPNGFFFLEPSYVSGFLACALITELMYFRRLWRMAAFGGAILGSLGATGMVMAVLAAPFLLTRQSPRMIALAVGLGLVGLIGLFATGAGEVLLGRLGEFSNPNSSGFARLVNPLVLLGRALAEPEHILTGIGAGNVSEFQSSAWPVLKLVTEYGVMTALAYIVFTFVCMWGSPNPGLFWSLFITFNFTGGYLQNPFFLGLIFYFLTLLRPVGPTPVAWRHERRKDPNPQRFPDRRRPAPG